jgi:threonine/homoserine/homoserine lactone efflux protein
MTLHTWLLYLGAVVLISCTPGPNVLYVATRSIRFGIGTALIGTAGCLLALVIMLVGSAAGLSAVLVTAPAAFTVLKYLGAAYLIFLGVMMWRMPDALEESPVAAAPRGTSNVAIFRGGFLVGISNPKLLIFAAAFFQQFIAPSAPWGPQFAVLVATFIAVELSFYVVYAVTARRLTDHLLRGVWRRRVNRAGGVIFMTFGAALLRYKP